MSGHLKRKRDQELTRQRAESDANDKSERRLLRAMRAKHHADWARRKPAERGLTKNDDGTPNRPRAEYVQHPTPTHRRRREQRCPRCGSWQGWLRFTMDGVEDVFLPWCGRCG
jgi:hypothetical protein